MDFYDILFAKSQNKGGGGGGGGNPYDSVVFYDYDGSIVASYKKTEFAAMPENPSHEGLISQGWNWTKAEIDNYLNDYPEATVNVGQMYITDDGKTRLYLELNEGQLSPYLELYINGTIEIDWGDGSSPLTWTGTSTTSVVGAVGMRHTYQPGAYVITIKVIDGLFNFYSGSNKPFLRKTDSTTGVPNYAYTCALKKVEFGLGVDKLNNSFYNFYRLETVTIPNYLEIGTNAFSSCRCLKFISLSKYGGSPISTSTFFEAISFPASSNERAMPSVYTNYRIKTFTFPTGPTRIPSYCVQQNTAIEKIIVPNGVTEIQGSAFSSCYSLSSLVFPDTLQSIAASAFAQNVSMHEYHFLSTTPPTLANANAFDDIPSDCIIYVPMASVEAYKTATNWSTYATQIQGE